jgi:hypothetical protein
VAALPEDPTELVPQDLSDDDSREYERRVVAELRGVMIGGQGGLLEVADIEVVGSRPNTLIVFRYHHRRQYIGRDPSLVAGPHAEVARLWDFAIDPEDQWSRGLMDPPAVLAAAIGSAFDAAELTLVDPSTLQPIGQPPKVFPRRDDLQRPRPT